MTVCISAACILSFKLMHRPLLRLVSAWIYCNELQTAAPAAGVGGVCARTPTLSQISPDASARKASRGKQTDNSVWPRPGGRIPQPKRFCVKRFWRVISPHDADGLFCSFAEPWGSQQPPGVLTPVLGACLPLACTPHHPTLSHQERDWAGLLGPAGWIQTMKLLNTGLC